MIGQQFVATYVTIGVGFLGKPHSKRVIVRDFDSVNCSGLG